MASMSENDWDTVLDINLKGSFNMSKNAVLKMMRKRYGRIINISSIGGSLGLSGQANYAASKAGQVALSKSLSKEVAKRNITVNNIAPGFIETEMTGSMKPEALERVKQSVPLNRVGQPDNIARAVTFILTNDYYSGRILEVDGGLRI